MMEPGKAGDAPYGNNARNPRRHLGRSKFTVPSMMLPLVTLFAIGGFVYAYRWSEDRRINGPCIDCKRQKEMAEEVYFNKPSSVHTVNRLSDMSDPLVAQLEQDFLAIEQSDPSLADGFKIVYDREVPFELRAMHTSDVDAGALEGMKVKVLTLGDETNLSALRVEVTTEADLFFHYTCVINNAGFLRLREDQSLVCEFPDFAVTLLKLFNRCIREPQRFLAVMLLGDDGAANLEFIENLEYKLVGALALPFRASSAELVREQITYRYSAVRARLALLTAQLKNANITVKPK